MMIAPVSEIADHCHLRHLCDARAVPSRSRALHSLPLGCILLITGRRFGATAAMAFSHLKPYLNFLSRIFELCCCQCKIYCQWLP